MPCDTKKNSELEQAKQPTESTRHCKQFFATKNICLKIAACAAAIVLAVFAYNEISCWFAYRNIEKIANSFFLTTDRFGWVTISSKMGHDIDSINNKMLLSYIVKQQNEIVKRQNSIDSKLDALNIFQNEYIAKKEAKIPASSSDPAVNTTTNTPTVNTIQKSQNNNI